MGSLQTGQRPAAQDATLSTAKPAAVHRAGELSAGIFLQHAKAEGGRNSVAANISLRRSYQDATGKWEHTTVLRRDDLLTAAYLLTKCYATLGDLDRSPSDAEGKADAKPDGDAKA